MNVAAKIFLAILVVVAVAASAVSLMAYRFMSEPVSTSDATVVFEVGPGESFKAVSRRLEQEGLVADARKFEIFARLAQGGAKARVGEYEIRKNLKPSEVLAIVSSGKSIRHVLTVPEGYNLFEVASLVEQQGFGARDEFIRLVRDPAFVREALGEDTTSLEGYLFPETYHLTKYTGVKGLVRLMVNRFKENYLTLEATAGWNTGRMTRHQLVTLASIIEKETGAPEERPVISSVFHNRLRLKMKLQTDPTVIYGIWERSGDWNRNITREDLVTPSRYNTYVMTGLPPGPIANPGLEALRSAGAPAITDYLFFVSRNDGTHVFSRDYSQHRSAVTQFQLDRKAREGKSWRDLKKRSEFSEAGKAK